MKLFRKKARPEERRSQMRNRIPGDDFEAMVRRSDGSVGRIAVKELCAGGAKIRMSRQKGEPLVEHEEVVLELVLSHPGRLIKLGAQVIRVDGQDVTLSMHELDLDQLPLDAESRMLLSRRKFPRHRMREHVGVDLTIESVVVSGVLHDLGEGGIGMKLTRDLAGGLKTGDVVDLEFQLPGLPNCTMKALLCHRTPFDGEELLGLQFQLDRRDQLNPIIEYLENLGG